MCIQCDWVINWSAISAITNVMLAFAALYQIRFICKRHRPILKLRPMSATIYLLDNIGTYQANDIGVQFGNILKYYGDPLHHGRKLKIILSATSTFENKLGEKKTNTNELKVSYVDIWGKEKTISINVGERKEYYDQKTLSLDTPFIEL